MFQALVQRFISGDASRKVLLLVGGTVAGQGIYMLSMPLLSRLYTPADFGVLAVYASLLSILASFAGLSYHLAIPLPEEDDTATSLLLLSLVLHGILTALIVVILALGGEKLLTSFRWGPMVPFMWLLPIGFFATGAYTIVSYYALRREAYKTLGRTRVTQKLLGAGVSVLFGVLGKASGLLWGQIAGMAGGVAALARDSVQRPLYLDGRNLLAVARKYRDFPLCQPWGKLLNTLSLELMPLLLFTLFPREMTGWFSMSLRVVQIPTVLLGQAIGQVYYQSASVAHREGALSVSTRSTLRSLVLLGTFPILSLGAASPALFPLLFGKRWAIAGEYSLIMAPYLWFQFLSSPISNAFLVVGRQRYLVVFQGFMLITGVLSLWLGHFVGGVYSPIAIYSFGKALIYIIYLTVILRFSVVKAGEWVPTVMKELMWTVFLCTPVIVAWLLFQTPFVSIGIWGGACVFWLIHILRGSGFFRRRTVDEDSDN